MLSIYSTCEVQSWTKRLGHFVFHVKKIAIQVNPSSSWTVLGFTSQTLFFKSCPNYGPHLCSGRGEKPCSRPSGSLRASSPFRGIAGSHARATPRKERRMRGASPLARAFTRGKWRACSRWLYCRLAANSIQST